MHSPKHKQLRFIALFGLLGYSFLTGSLYAGEQVRISKTLNWKPLESVKVTETQEQKILTFTGSTSMDGFGSLPAFYLKVPANPSGELLDSAGLSNTVFIALTPEEVLAIDDPQLIPPVIDIHVGIAEEKSITYSEITLVPFRRNPVNGLIEKLLSFEIVGRMERRTPELKSVASYADHSVLQTGTWYKLAVGTTGIYKLSFEDMQSMGITATAIDPRNIRIYSNGGGMTPEPNSTYRTDDLKENAIFVNGEQDGTFGPGDYILFYGESQDTWSYNTEDKLFHHKKNIYADKTYYFLNWDKGPGKRLQTDPGSNQPANIAVTRFNDFGFYEMDNINLLKSGREWYDKEYFDVTSSREYSFTFPNIDPTYPAVVTAVVAARSTAGSSSFTIAANGNNIGSVSIPSVPDQFLATYARQRSATGEFTASDPAITIKLTYNRQSVSAIGYLNYIELNVSRQLTMSGPQMAFRNTLTSGADRILEYKITTQGQALTVWDVTRMGDPKAVTTTSSSNMITFKVATDTLSEYIAFDGTSFLTPENTGKIANQDLHGAGNFDYIIVSYPPFVPEAERLATFHREHDGYNVLVTTTDVVYNEFSSGAQDVSAIRDFMRMEYDKAPSGSKPRYLLLFGDASYDFKSRTDNNTNMVPAFQSQESLDPTNTYVTDDYFVLLNESEGKAAAGKLDMGVGRLPVRSLEEATSAVNKIIYYCENSLKVKNDWRNVLCFVADDGDVNLHMNQVEDLTTSIHTTYPVYNIDKIYLDAYQQESTPGGQRCPEVNDALNKRVEKGALIVSYTGHGGEVGWAHERILEVPDINSWTNMDNMPVFVTATCEFSRYDDPERASAGELVFTNPNGGGIALFTTTRPTYAGANYTLASNFYQVAFEKVDGQYLKMGDLILLAKNNTGSDANTRKFVLLGDPALQMAYPTFNVSTTSITTGDSKSVSDTLKALSEVVVSGEVTDNSGQLMSGFSGEVYSTVFDKPAMVQTLSNDGDPVMTFEIQKNQVYKGKAEVVNGKFSFSFIVPKDIAYSYGNGKISYYARNEETDANGYDDQVIVGGYNRSAQPDTKGPSLELFMNDNKFISGSVTGPEPVLLAYVTDESGINMVGNGIGHDITAVLDNNTQVPIILNDYYVADLNTFKSGEVTYPMNALSEGRHHITVKVWDVNNNSTEETISFVVASGEKFVIQNLMNYPNPFKNYTTFSFETNQSNTNMDVLLQVYNMFGNQVRTIKTTIYATGFRIEPLQWDGTSDGGWKLDAGTYVYLLKLTLPDGATTQTSSKVILLR